MSRSNASARSGEGLVQERRREVILRVTSAEADGGGGGGGNGYVGETTLVRDRQRMQRKSADGKG